MDPLNLTLKYTVDMQMIPITLHNYTDATSGAGVSNMGSFVFDHTGDLKAKIMFVQEADGSKSVSLAFE